MWTIITTTTTIIIIIIYVVSEVDDKRKKELEAMIKKLREEVLFLFVISAQIFANKKH